MTALPPFLERCCLTNDEALRKAIRSGARIGTGFATSEPHTFYSTLWDHITSADLEDIEIRQALFMAPHRLLVGDALEHLSAEKAEPETGSLFGRLRSEVRELIDKAEALKSLIEHYKELEQRRISFVSGFLGPAVSTIIPDSIITKTLAPAWAGRNIARSGIVRWQSIHFPDAPDALIFDESGRFAIDTFALVMTPPDKNGELSHGLANASNADTLELAIESSDVSILLYLNEAYPFTRGHAEAPNTITIDRLRRPADEGRLIVVRDSGNLPALPAGTFGDPSATERTIAEHVVNHIESHRELTLGRALQVGIGSTGVLAVRMLKDASWRGRSYTEMLEPFTLDLFDAGVIDGSHFILKDGRRQMLDGKLICTFTLGPADSGFYERLDDNPDILVSAASRVVIPEAFYGGLGINNILGIDFCGHVNASGRDVNPYSGIGGAGMILRGLANGGVAYLCLKSTHRAPDGERRSSIFPFLPTGTPVSLIGPDLWGGRSGARIYLVTEHGVVRLSGQSQDRFIQALISVAHPDDRSWLERRAWEEFRA